MLDAILEATGRLKSLFLEGILKASLTAISRGSILNASLEAIFGG